MTLTQQQRTDWEQHQREREQQQRQWEQHILMELIRDGGRTQVIRIYRKELKRYRDLWESDWDAPGYNDQHYEVIDDFYHRVYDELILDPAFEMSLFDIEDSNNYKVIDDTFDTERDEDIPQHSPWLETERGIWRFRYEIN